MLIQDQSEVRFVSVLVPMNEMRVVIRTDEFRFSNNVSTRTVPVPRKCQERETFWHSREIHSVAAVVAKNNIALENSTRVNPLHVGVALIRVVES